MKQKIELGKEYRTRGGGKAIVYRDDGGQPSPYIGAVFDHDEGWLAGRWYDDGRYALHKKYKGCDIILPRRVKVTIEVPPDARHVYDSKREYERLIHFTPIGSEADGRIPIEDWIKEQEEA